MSWVYWLFLAMGALALYRLLHERHVLHKAGKPTDPASAVSIYGPLILVIGLFVAYQLAGSVARWFIVVMLIAIAVGPFVASFVEGLAGEQKARRVRIFFFLVLAGLALLIGLTFVVKLLLVLLALAGIVGLLLLAAILLKLTRPGKKAS